MARRQKAAYRKKSQNRLSMILVTVVVAALMVTVQIGSAGLRDKINAKSEEAAQLEEQIAAERQRQAQIEEFGKEVQTKGYIENMAREKLGLVYEDEILFKQGR